MMRLVLILGFVVWLGGLNKAQADCTNPAKPEGTIIYNTDHKVAQFCNGTDWIGMAGGSTSIMEGDTMVDGWPDAIVCDTANWNLVSFLSTAPHKATGRYIYTPAWDDTFTNYSHQYDSSGNYVSGPSGTNCNKPIAQLYADGQAFNFVGGGSDSEGSATPSGAVMAFALNSCPSGWSEYIPARGRFIRGIDSTGTVDPDGVRAVGSTQEDEFKKHSHGMPRGDQNWDSGYGNSAWGFNTSGSTSETGGDETRPKT